LHEHWKVDPMGTPQLLSIVPLQIKFGNVHAVPETTADGEGHVPASQLPPPLLKQFHAPPEHMQILPVPEHASP
jgi:hypothetical protein